MKTSIRNPYWVVATQCEVAEGIMTMVKKRFYLCIVAMVAIAVLSSSTTFPEQGPSARFENVLKKMVEAINAQDFSVIQQDFGEIMLKAFPLEKSKPFFENLLANYGKIKSVGTPRLPSPHQAVFPAHFQKGQLDIKVVLDNQDMIIGLWFLPHTPAIPVVEKHETRLRLPFKGNWLVFWGGDTRELNQHHDVANQKFAFDFLVADSKGKTHKSEGKKNEEYFAFGREALSPADGIVTDVITGVPDNVPGSMNPYSALGNAVFIKHREHEISVLAHLKQGSIKVKVGDRVKGGQVIGHCGNSGHSSEPHLHYHLQNTPIIQDGTGMKCFFENVIVTRNSKEQSMSRFSPVKGDIVRGESASTLAL